ncbi:MAG: PDZ domain-containing protein [Mariniblastus sp.]
MNFKNLFGMTIVALSAVFFALPAQAQVITNFGGNQFQQGVPVRQGMGVNTQPQYQTINKADLEKISIGAIMYDAGSAVGVRSVYTNSPAQKAGLESGDMITKANGQPIQNAASLNQMISAMTAGSKVKLTTTRRGAKAKEIEVEAQKMADIFAASNVPEPTVLDDAVAKVQRQIGVTTQQMKNLQADMADMEKQLASQKAELEELKKKAAAARKQVEAEKAAKAAAAKAKADAAADSK